MKDEGVRKRQHLEPEPFPAKLRLFSLKDECRGAAEKSKAKRIKAFSNRERKGRAGMKVCMCLCLLCRTYFCEHGEFHFNSSSFAFCCDLCSRF